MAGEVFMQISRSESVNLVLGFEKFFGQSALAVLSEVGGADATTRRVRHRLGEDVAFLLGDGRDVQQSRKRLLYSTPFHR